MAGLGADADGERRAGAAPGTGGGADGAGECEEALAVFQLDELALDLAGMRERCVQVPERAAAGTGRWQRRGAGGEALGNGAGTVDSDEEEGDATGAGAAEGGEAVGDLLQTAAEAGLQELDIIAGGLTGGEEAAIGHEQGCGGVFGERHGGGVVAEGGGGGGDLGLQLDEGELDGGGEAA